MPASAKVDTPVAAYVEMSQRWPLIDDLMGGTAAMRRAGSRWMPREDREEDGPFQRRLQRSFLVDAYRDGIDRLSARPFAKKVAVNGELPQELRPILTDADGLGSDLTTYANGFFREALNRGVNHVLVDMVANPERLVDADKRLKRAAPYFRTVTAPDLIGWRGTDELRQIRFKSNRLEEVGEWGEGVVPQVHVFEPGKRRLFEKGDGQDEFVEVPNSEVAIGVKDVPLVTLNLTHPGTMCAVPTLDSLAWLNLAHWQSASDQRNCLRFARLAMLFFAGVTEDEAKKIVPGPSGLFTARDPEASGQFIEHGGKAIELGRQDLQDLEAAMAILALLPMLQQTGNPTATGRAIDEANVQSNLHKWVRLLEHALEDAFRLAAEWKGVALPEDFSVDVFSDFGLSLRAQEELRALIDCRKSRLISQPTFLAEVKRRGLLADTVDLADEEAALEKDPPDLSGIFPPFRPTAAVA